MMLWVDDLRQPPDQDWVWCKTSATGITALAAAGPGGITQMSLDHDLGGEDTTRPIVRWLCENALYWPGATYVHTANPVGRQWLEAMIARYGPPRPSKLH